MRAERSLMYTVVGTYPGGHITGRDPVAFFRMVAARINDYTAGRYGPYDMDTFTSNLARVCTGIHANRIAEPPTLAGWVDALVAEFVANDWAFEPTN